MKSHYAVSYENCKILSEIKTFPCTICLRDDILDKEVMYVEKPLVSKVQDFTVLTMKKWSTMGFFCNAYDRGKYNQEST